MAPYAGPDSEARLERLVALARELDVRPNQLVLAWLLAQRAPRLVPLVGPRTLAQLEDNLAAASIELPRAVLAQLDAAGV
jgi:aryl-alcohol dehydrogenase-like predicted oxidoreductase